MSDAVLVPGKRFRLYRERNGVPGAFDYVGLATTLAFTTSRVTVDTTDGDAIAWSKAGYGELMSWDLSFSGKVDVLAFAAIEDDQRADDAHVYRIVSGQAGAGRSYTGPILFPTIQRQAQDGGFVAFSAQAKGAGELTFANL